jgi:Trypsin-co-occurring domain 1
MTPEYVEVPGSDGQIIPFAAAGYDGPVPAGRMMDGIKKNAAQTLDDGISIINAIARAVTGNVASLDDPPSHVSAEVGLTVTAGATFAVASSSTEAHIVITMDWDPVPGSKQHPGTA